MGRRSRVCVEEIKGGQQKRKGGKLKNHGTVNEVVVESNDSSGQKHDVAPEFRIYADLSHGTQAMNTDIHRDKGR